MSNDLRQSYDHCQRLARRAASNFYWSFWLLPRVKRRAMCSLYAFSRVTDDLADNDQPAETRRQRLIQWRHELQEALAGRPAGPLWPALADTARDYAIPHRHLFAIVDGVMMDLDRHRYETFDELRHYCYHVASAVGLACIHIWGFDDEAACDLADTCGIAFQLTNILRDLRQDARQGRVYLPNEDLERFGCDDQDLARGLPHDRLRALLRFEVQRAESFYQRSVPLARHLDRDSRRTFAFMFSAYGELLSEIKRRDGDVFSRPVRLGLPRKVRLLAGALGRLPRPASARAARDGVPPKPHSALSASRSAASRPRRDGREL